MILDQEKVERFRNMTLADPENELGFLSLGRALVDGKQFQQAIAPLMQALRLNAGLSIGYALLAEAQRQVGDSEGAINTLTRGYKVAQDRGDLMPRNQMADMLKELGAPLPEEKAVELTPELAAAGHIQCRRCGRVAPKMKERPFSGVFGEQIWQSICNPCFQLWIRQGTKVINELRLNLTEKSAQDVYDEHMKDFLNLK
ncbi:MAG TPA: Fe(2+)-trafficking protein [Phycisphaerae bacterium]|nr:Fe(2+)-trafficking protein [Phycisphaerae bacterium]